MFPYQIAKSGLTLSKVIGGISKSLSIANQVIPIYQQSRPILDKAKEMLGGLNKPKKEVSKTTTVSDTSIKQNNSPTIFLK